MAFPLILAKQPEKLIREYFILIPAIYASLYVGTEKT